MLLFLLQFSVTSYHFFCVTLLLRGGIRNVLKLWTIFVIFYMICSPKWVPMSQNIEKKIIFKTCVTNYPFSCYPG